MLERSIVWVGKSLTVLSLMLVFGLTAAENYRMQELPFIPEMGGVFRVGTAHWFYVGRGKNLQIFDNSLNPRQLVFLSIDTAAIDFADIDSDGAEDLIELAQLQVNVRRFRNGVFSQPETIIRERLVFPIYVDNLEQSALCADFDRDGFTDFFLPAEGKFFAYRNENGVKFTRIAILPYQPRGSFTNRLWQNSDLMSNAIRSTVIIPQPFFIDFNRDGVLDAAARVDEKVYYFLSRTTESGTKPFAETVLRIYPMPQEDVYVSYAEFSDFDNDGQQDLIYSAVKGLGLNIRAEIKIFRGKNNIPEPAGAIVHTVQGGVYSPLLAEIKGKKILIQPTLDTGIGLFVNYVLRSKVLLTLQFLDPLDEKNNPLEKTTLTFDSRESGIPGFAYGDFDGDGQTDFILGTEINGITIYGGNAQFEKKVIAQLTAPAYGIFKPVRNPDGTHSLFIYMTQRSKAPKKNAVYLVPIVLRKD